LLSGGIGLYGVLWFVFLPSALSCFTVYIILLVDDLHYAPSLSDLCSLCNTFSLLLSCKIRDPYFLFPIVSEEQVLWEVHALPGRSRQVIGVGGTGKGGWEGSTADGD